MEIGKATNQQMKIRRAKEQSIKVKTESIKLAGVQGAKSATRQIEGGQEVLDAAMTAYVISQPVRAVAKQVTKLVKKKVKENKDKRSERKEQQRRMERSVDKERHKSRSDKKAKIPIPENQIKSIKRTGSVASRNSSIRHNLPYY